MIREIFVLSVLGALLSLDATAVGQVLISQPLLACPIIGLVLGDLQTGLLVGVLLQLIWVGKLPVGGSNPSLGTALLGIFTVGLVIIYQGGGIHAGLIPVAIVLGTMVAYLGQKGESALNRFNNHLLHWADRLIQQNKLWGMAFINGLSLIIIFVFSFLLISIGTFLGLKVCSFLFKMFTPQFIRGLVLTERMLPVLGLAVVFKLFVNRKNFAFFLIALLLTSGWKLF